MSPIVVFVYNRPEHTRKMLESLIQNKESIHSDLYVFCDGVKENATITEIKNREETINVIKNQYWNRFFNKIEIRIKKENQGLAKSIFSGINEILKISETVIVLEDDLILSPYFLNFMNMALKLYENDKEVMHIGGFTPIHFLKLQENFYFLRFTSSWGWGTWKRAWDSFNNDSSVLLSEIQKRTDIKDFNFNNNYNFVEMLQQNIENRINSWAINWYATVFMSNGLAIYPNKSLILNKGFDGTGIHCGVSYKQKIKLSSKIIKMKYAEPKELGIARMKYEKYFKALNTITLFDKIEYKLKSLFKNVKR